MGKQLYKYNIETMWVISSQNEEKSKKTTLKAVECSSFCINVLSFNHSIS